MSDSNKKNKKEKDSSVIFTKETFGVVLVLFATLSLVCLITRDAVFSLPGQWVNAFLFGCFGYFAYAVVLYTAILGVQLIIGKVKLFGFKRTALLTIAFVIAAIITHTITLHGNASLPYGEYLVRSYNMASGGFATASGGGIVTAVFSYLVISLISEIGTYVVMGLAFATTVFFLVKDVVDGKSVAGKDKKPAKFRSSFVKGKKNGENDGEKEVEAIEPAIATAPVVTPKPVENKKQSLFVNNPNDFYLKNKRELLKKGEDAQMKMGFSDKGLGVVTTAQERKAISEQADLKTKLDYIKTPPEIDLASMRTEIRPQESVSKPEFFVPKQPSQTAVSDYIGTRAAQAEQEPVQNTSGEIPFIEHAPEENIQGDSAAYRAEVFGKYAEVEDITAQAQPIEEEPEVITRAVGSGRIEEIKEETSTEEIPFIEENFTQEVDDKVSEIIANEPEVTTTTVRSERARSILFGDKEENAVQEKPVENTRSSLGFTSRAVADGNLSASRRGESLSRAETPAEEKPKKTQPPINRQYFRPPFDLLESYTPPVDMPKENHEERMEIIQRTLEEFHINAVPQSYVQGPSITRYEVMMPAGVSVRKVLAFDDDLKMRLSAKDGVRIEAPIPGKNLVGIEVANTVKTTVGLREILEGSANDKQKSGGLMFALGKDLVGKPIMDDLSKGPHYLVAGATGSGKSVCLNLMIVSLIMRYSPEDLRLILVDPKGVEFVNYEHIPHLMIDEIITEPKKALAVLSWAYTEMERRFAVFRENGAGLVVDIDSYNKEVASKTVPKMPRIVIIIDELADLMETCKKDLESRIRAIAQKARAAGIHLVLATQRPSVDIITGTIKANLPSRIAFKVMNFNDSQTILSEAGAEKLLGNGDMLYKTARMSSTERYQGAYISSREVNNIVSYIKEHNAAYFDDELKDYLDREGRPKQEESAMSMADGGEENNEFDSYFLKALWLAVNSGGVSISQLQRRFQIGYSRAGGLVDRMETMGFVSANEGSKARRVLLTKEEFIERFGEMPD